MSGISSFILAFCIVCTVIGGLSIIAPSGSFAKPLKFVSCLVFLCVVLGGIFGMGEIDFEIQKNENEVSENASAGTLAKQVFEEALRQSDIEFEKIEVFTDKSEAGGIFITEVVVYSHAPQEKIRGIISGEGAYDVRVVNE